MKKLILALTLVTCSSVALAASAALCSAGPTPAGNVTGATDGTTFVRATFAPTCSPNTVMIYEQDTGKLWAAAASTKGQSFFGSSTNGGSVGSLGQCNTGKTCGDAAAVKTKLETPLTAAAALGNT